MRRARLAMVASAVLGACAGDGNFDPPEPQTFSLSGVVEGDTALALFPAPIVVTMRDASGDPVPGLAVRYEGLDSGLTPSIRFAPDERLFLTRSLTDTTGADGASAVFASLGCRVGIARLRVRVPSRGVDTTLRFTVVPGNAAALRVEPRDSAVFVGGTYVFRGGVRDRCGNVRPEAVTLNALTPEVVVLVPDTVRGVAVGRVLVEAASGARRDTVSVTSVPRAVLAATLLSGQGCRLVTQHLDGSNSRVRVVVPPFLCIDLTPSWGTNDRVFYTDPSTAELAVVDALGAQTPLPCSPCGNDAFAPRLASTGILYFSSGTLAGGGPLSRIFRSNPQVSNAAPLSPPSSFHTAYPSPSPTGARLAMVSFMPGGPQLSILDTNGTVTPLGVAGSLPSWSPDGTLLAFNRGNRLMVAPPVVNATVVTLRPGQAYFGQIAWTPDSKHLVAWNGNTLDLIEVATGTVTPLPFTASKAEPALRVYP